MERLLTETLSLSDRMVLSQHWSAPTQNMGGTALTDLQVAGRMNSDLNKHMHFCQDAKDTCNNKVFQN